jgi:hypothetical protein
MGAAYQRQHDGQGELPHRDGEHSRYVRQRDHAAADRRDEQFAEDPRVAVLDHHQAREHGRERDDEDDLPDCDVGEVVDMRDPAEGARKRGTDDEDPKHGQ